MRFQQQQTTQHVHVLYSIDDFGYLSIYLYTNLHYLTCSHALMLLYHLYLACQMMRLLCVAM